MSKSLFYVVSYIRICCEDEPCELEEASLQLEQLKLLHPDDIHLIEPEALRFFKMSGGALAKRFNVATNRVR
ncbi:MAG: hypothetical protein UY48_C0038G0007 [Candidatus Gottesmanbacteria bacterium GW2011_GWB1_49_7]|uniref:Uncharacterized protein n=1 Tax=Candidatus Gottesmanbacteria bacterium GW2011_GWB1_49_7 TaxID=1618448 RepID=A0A0G1Y693_9BACT|nr:MAG: hypothetical protein UY48_C0038G0007 [Candidatus Gottesmanbacteria bacterium GW2011_GWB1_49_7]